MIGNYGLSVEQQRFQMSLWSMMSAPLFVSTDLRTLRRESQEILLNSLVLSINQDELGRLGLEVQRVSVTISLLLTLSQASCISQHSPLCPMHAANAVCSLLHLQLVSDCLDESEQICQHNSTCRLVVNSIHLPM